MKTSYSVLFFIFSFSSLSLVAQPDWEYIKSNATFTVSDDTYETPVLQPIHVPGWEDGLFMTRDGRHLYSTYLPLDVFTWLGDFVLDPECFDFTPYYREPLLDIDTVTNSFGCPNFVHSDIVLSSRENVDFPFSPWAASNLQTAFSFDGGAHGVLASADTFDVFVYTKDGVGTSSTDLMFMRNVSINPTTESAVPILVTEEQEDNPHIERLNDSTLLLFFDRARYMYYALSYDDGDTWEDEVLITSVLNDQAPYDVQPHLWNDGVDWWVYFCAEDEGGIRCIYKSKQLVANDWDSWAEKELVLAPNIEIGEEGYIYGVGEPTLSEWGDLSFVTVYGNPFLSDTTDVFDCDPWIMYKEGSPLSVQKEESLGTSFKLYPNPSEGVVSVERLGAAIQPIELVLFNALGMEVGRYQLDKKTVVLSLREVPSGVYYFQEVGGRTTAIRWVKL